MQLFIFFNNKHEMSMLTKKIINLFKFSPRSSQLSSLDGVRQESVASLGDVTI